MPLAAMSAPQALLTSAFLSGRDGGVCVPGTIFYPHPTTYPPPTDENTPKPASSISKAVSQRPV